MELSIFLAQLLGAYLLIVGVIVIIRQDAFRRVFATFARERALMMALALGELVAGLAIIIAHPIFTFDWRGLITLLGVWLIVESIILMTIKVASVSRMMKRFNTPGWYTGGGFTAAVIGGYLLGAGLGLW